MKFPVGTRVRMKQHADWKSDALGTITAIAREREQPDGSIEIEYWIDFDIPQSDLTDEMHGYADRAYQASTVMERFLELVPNPEAGDTRKCDECSSGYLAPKSKMDNLCPECAHQLYGYANCPHDFVDGRCRICYWDGSVSDYVRGLKRDRQ